MVIDIRKALTRLSAQERLRSLIAVLISATIIACMVVL